MESLSDTSPDVQLRVDDKLRAMTAAQKLQLSLAMSRAVRDLAIAGIRQRHPRASDREVIARLAVIQYGEALARAAYPEIAGFETL